jgi:hypothetical protein
MLLVMSHDHTSIEASLSTERGTSVLVAQADIERGGSDTLRPETVPSRLAHHYKVIARDRALNQVAHVLTESEETALRVAALWTRQAVGTGLRVEAVRTGVEGEAPDTNRGEQMENPPAGRVPNSPPAEVPRDSCADRAPKGERR